MTPASDNLGFLLDCPEAERVMRLRELRSLAAVYVGWSSPLKQRLDQASVFPNDIRINAALTELDRLPARLRRRLLSAFGELCWPKRPVPAPDPDLIIEAAE